ncbi:MAG TPA: SPOR domain-containing protein, partial [Candidatus Poseidoniales archaeon]
EPEPEPKPEPEPEPEPDLKESQAITNCPICGTEAPVGSSSCAVCGYSFIS